MPQPLAVFYGWPSLVNGSRGDVARAAEHFGPFAAAILGEACPVPGSDPRGREVAERIADRCLVYGYVSLGCGPNQPGWSRADVLGRLDAWARWGARGILLDCAGHDFGVSAERLAGAVAAAHDRGLRVVVNAWEPFDVLSSPAELGDGDALLAENDVLRHGVWRSLGEFHGRLARVELARRELGVTVWAVVTSAPSAPAFYGDLLTDAVARSWRAAGAEPPRLFGLSDPLYGAADNRLPLPDPAQRASRRIPSSAGVGHDPLSAPRLASVTTR
jgi:hypothetical protein